MRRGHLYNVSDIVNELDDVLSRERLPFEREQIDEFVGKVLSTSEMVTPETNLEVIEDDPDDDKILECAVAGNADYIISGDSHLLDIGEYRDIRVLNPDQFLERK